MFNKFSEDDNSLSYYELASNQVQVSYTILHLCITLFLLSFGVLNGNSSNYVQILELKIEGLLGWPILMIAYIIYLGSIIFLDHNGYRLNRTRGVAFTYIYFLSLYIIDIGIVYLILTIIQHFVV